MYYDTKCLEASLILKVSINNNVLIQHCWWNTWQINLGTIYYQYRHPPEVRSYTKICKSRFYLTPKSSKWNRPLPLYMSRFYMVLYVFMKSNLIQMHVSNVIHWFVNNLLSCQFMFLWSNFKLILTMYPINSYIETETKYKKPNTKTSLISMFI